MARSVEVNEYRQQCYSHEATIKRLNDELRDTENELNMAKFQTKDNPADKERIQELETQLAGKDLEHQNELQELREKLERYEKQISNVQNLEMQLDSLQSEAKGKADLA